VSKPASRINPETIRLATDMCHLVQRRPAVGLGTAEEYSQTPQKLRDDAERCFRLANTINDARSHDALMEYGRELLDRAEKMEAASRRASSKEGTRASSNQDSRDRG
jgi:hypothetical protein